MWLVTIMLFVPVGKRSNSHSHMFFKIENFLISLKMLLKILQYSQKNTCVLEFLFNKLYLKKMLQHKCFPVNIAKCLSTAFYIEYICEYEFFEYYAML